MKANEAKSKFVYPDKLYARTNNNITLDISYAPQTLEAVEYTRTDAFVKKAKLWLAEIHRVCDITDEHGYRIELRQLQARFENYIKKVEAKYHEGDWVIDKQNIVHQIAKVIENVTYHTYGYDIVGGGYFNDNTEGVRIWTIQDAKDGDILCCENGWTCIFKTLVNDENFSSYCFMDSTKWFCETGSESHTLKEEFVKAYNGKIYPATKEQRDLLFQKMKEAGYEWNAEKKLLKNIEQAIDY